MCVLLLRGGSKSSALEVGLYDMSIYSIHMHKILVDFFIIPVKHLVLDNYNIYER